MINTDKKTEDLNATNLFTVDTVANVAPQPSPSHTFQYAAISDVLAVVRPQAEMAARAARLGAAASGDFMPVSDPDSYTNYQPPFGIYDPDNAYGVPSDPDKAQQQLLDMMKWITSVGITNNIPSAFVYEMLGFEKRLDTTWANSTDPTIASIKSTLADLANEKVAGTTLANRIVSWSMDMELYSSQDPTGAAALSMLNSLRAAIGSGSSNPVLAGLTTTINYYVNSDGTATQPFTDWLAGHVQNGKVVDSQGNTITYKDWCDANGQNLYNWFAGSNINNAWQTNIMAWFQALIEKFMSTLGAANALPIVMYILGEMSNSFQNEAGALSFTAKALQTAVTSFSKVVSDGSTANITPSALQELVDQTRATAILVGEDPRMAAASGVISTAKSLLSIVDNNPPADLPPDHPKEVTIEYEVLQYEDPNSVSYHKDDVLSAAASAWNANATISGQLQTISTELQAASSNLTNVSQNTAPQIQTKQQMITQVNDVSQDAVSKWNDMISQMIKNFTVQ